MPSSSSPDLLLSPAAALQLWQQASPTSSQQSNLENTIPAIKVSFLDVRWQLGRSAAAARLAFSNAHIPGARYIDLDQVLAAPASPLLGRHPLPSPTDFLNQLRKLHLDFDHTFICYDDNHGMSASRLVWMLRALGFSACLLDGGIQAWEGPLETGSDSAEDASNKPQTSVSSSAHPPASHSPVWPSEQVAEITEVAEFSPGAMQLIDVRAAERFSGEVEPIDPRAGHIPGAINLPASELLTASGEIKSAPEIQALLQKKGINLEEPTVLYCGSGVTASFAWLALTASGMSQIRIFPGSFSQWANHFDLPVEADYSSASAAGND